MLFPSITFLFYFLPLFFIVYCAAPGITAKNIVLLAASLLFYAWGEPRFVLLLAGQIVLNYGLALAIGAADGGRRFRVTATAVAANLLLLAVFKYADFALGSLNAALGRDTFALPGIALPLGISFFTFHAISYLVDVHRGEVRPNRSLLSVAVYIAMFPQLVAGPIIRYHTIARRLSERRTTLGRASAGARIFVIGLAQKVLIADEVSRIAEAVFDKLAQPSLAEAWLGLSAYTIQIYFDFAGYSNMAIGLALALGFSLPAQLPPALCVALGHRVLAALAHQPVAVAARLSLHPARRQPRPGARDLSQSLPRVRRLRPVARRELDLRDLGHASRRVPDRRARRTVGRAGAPCMARADLSPRRDDDRLGVVPRARPRSCAVVLREPRGPPWRVGIEHRGASRRCIRSRSGRS